MWQSLELRCGFFGGKFIDSLFFVFWWLLVGMSFWWVQVALLTLMCVVLCCVGGGGDMDVCEVHSELGGGLVVEEYRFDE